MPHVPVLLNETLALLDPKPGEFFIDGTLGGGGHAKEIIKRISPDGMFLGIDFDRRAIEGFAAELKTKNYQLKTIIEIANYADLPKILTKKRLPMGNGLLLDLGFSSEQLERSGRGFSFRNSPAGEEPLIMTYSDEEKPVAELLKKISVKDLELIIRNYGEERFAGRIAKAIKSNLPINTSRRLADIIVSAVPRNYERGRIHPATRTFQALRIFANHELKNLDTFLQSIPEIIAPQGKIAIISFHSLEDRLVKIYFKNLAKTKQAMLLNKKPITAAIAEIKSNPRSRSAKLRGISIISRIHLE